MKTKSNKAQTFLLRGASAVKLALAGWGLPVLLWSLGGPHLKEASRNVGPGSMFLQIFDLLYSASFSIAVPLVTCTIGAFSIKPSKDIEATVRRYRPTGPIWISLVCAGLAFAGIARLVPVLVSNIEEPVHAWLVILVGVAVSWWLLRIRNHAKLQAPVEGENRSGLLDGSMPNVEQIVYVAKEILSWPLPLSALKGEPSRELARVRGLVNERIRSSGSDFFSIVPTGWVDQESEVYSSLVRGGQNKELFIWAALQHAGTHLRVEVKCAELARGKWVNSMVQTNWRYEETLREIERLRHSANNVSEPGCLPFMFLWAVNKDKEFNHISALTDQEARALRTQFLRALSEGVETYRSSVGFSGVTPPPVQFEVGGKPTVPVDSDEVSL